MRKGDKTTAQLAKRSGTPAGINGSRRRLLPESMRGARYSGSTTSIHSLPVRTHQLSRVEQPKSKGPSPLLTDNERSVLTWLSLGKRCYEIAPIMGIKENAVNQIMFRIKNKIGCNTMAGAVAKALRKRLIE